MGSGECSAPSLPPPTLPRRPAQPITAGFKTSRLKVAGADSSLSLLCDFGAVAPLTALSFPACEMGNAPSWHPEPVIQPHFGRESWLCPSAIGGLVLSSSPFLSTKPDSGGRCGRSGRGVLWLPAGGQALW